MGSGSEEPSSDVISAAGRRGRGSLSRATGRFERYAVEAFDDGWGTTDEDPPPLRTEVLPDNAKSVITRNTSPDVGFDRSINPYRGCEHGCVYCFARPTHAYLGFSPGLDFESRLFAKFDAPALLEKELSKPRYKPQVIALGVNTDCYQPIEREYRITRGVLEVLNAYNHPVGIVTKSQLIQRDLDILADMAARDLVTVAISLTTLDRGLARKMEPRAATPARRVDTIRALTETGVPVTALMAPVIPGLNDPEIDAVMSAAAGAGATRAGYVLLRLPLEIKTLFREWLAENYPDRANKVINLMRSMRGGRDYTPCFGERMRGTGAYADLIENRFLAACRRLGLNAAEHAIDSSNFKVPERPNEQLGLFQER
ncbi:MAG: PA0069 family radical SAM protein [Alphaproteobacteria bacterium]